MAAFKLRSWDVKLLVFLNLHSDRLSLPVCPTSSDKSINFGNHSQPQTASSKHIVHCLIILSYVFIELTTIPMPMIHMPAWWLSAATVIGCRVHNSSYDCGGCCLVQTALICIENCKNDAHVSDFSTFRLLSLQATRNTWSTWIEPPALFFLLALSERFIQWQNH
jgi:hypothetical protein